MKEIDIGSWSRKAHFNCFSGYDNPIFSLTARLDVTRLRKYSKKTKTAFFTNLLYALTLAMNKIEPLRLRFVDGKVVLFDTVDPSYIVMNDEQVIVTCRSAVSLEYPTFYRTVRHDTAEAKKVLERDDFNPPNATRDVFYVSCLPWLDFLSMSNPYHYSDADASSIPRVTIGKFVRRRGHYELTMDVAAHHALLDGYPLSQLFLTVQHIIHNIKDYYPKEGANEG